VGDGHLFQGIPGEEHVATTLAELQAPSKDTSTWHRSGAAFVHLPTPKELAAIVKGVDPHGVLAPCRNGIGREDQ